MTDLAGTAAPLFVPLPDLVARVGDGDKLGVGGALLSRLPLAALHELAERSPRDLVYVAWGGGLPLEILLGTGSVAKVVFCFSSLDVFGLAPLFRRALEEGTVAVDEWSAFAFASRLEAAKQNLPSMPFRVHAGSDLLAGNPAVAPSPDSTAEVPVGLAGRLDLDSFLIHAGRADEAGNLEIAGSRGMDATAAFAARRVLATVEEVVETGELGSTPRSFVIPRHFVDAISVVPFGAYPTSCLPYYAADFSRLAEITSTSPPPPSPLPTPEVARRLAGAARLSPQRVRSVVREVLATRRHATTKVPATPDEMMVCWLARRLENTSICSAGAVSPLAVTSYLLAKATHAPRLTIFMTSGGLLDVALRPMLLGLGEALDTASAAVQCGGEDSYRWYYQQGRVTCEVVTAAQIDRRARTNNVAVTSPSGRIVRLPGQGGMADVADLHENFYLYLTRQSRLSLVESVEHVSASRALVAAPDRVRAGLAPGSVALITNLAAFVFDEARGELVPESIHPGVSVAELVEATGFELEIPAGGVPETEPPSEEMLRVLRDEIDPLGIRLVEFAPARERGDVLKACIAAEADLLDRALHLQ